MAEKNKCIWIFSWLGLMETYHHEKMTTNTDVAFLVAIGSNRKYNRLLLSFQREYNDIYIYDINIINRNLTGQVNSVNRIGCIRCAFEHHLQI